MKLWQPSSQIIEDSNIYKFQKVIEKKFDLKFENYQEFWEWSVNETALFWQSCADYFKLIFHGKTNSIFEKPAKGMIGTEWFKGSKISYAEHVFANKNSNNVAIIYKNENHIEQEVTWTQLENRVLNLQKHFKGLGLKSGDRVVAYMPNNLEVIYSFLAANSLGLIWSCCSPDFGQDSIIDRFVQIEPKLFIATATYSYHGKDYDNTEIIQNISKAIPSLENTLIVESELWQGIISKIANEMLEFTPVPFDHPIWILYSSGTTGKPKAITHSTGGNLIEHYKALSLHQNCKPDERFFWYSTTGWMMWNYALSSLLVGCTLCIFDGSPSFPASDSLWDFAEKNKLNHFGIGAAFYLNYMKNNKAPIKQDLSNLKFIGSTGSPLSEEGFKWIYSHVKSDVHLGSISGGTDVCSAFVGSNPTLPVHLGEIQCRMLGAKIEAFNDQNQPVINEVGELYITAPMPSMPLFFWNDPNNEKYRTSYYENNENIWCHGDWIKITKHNGVIIYGRSDATLNRDGVRIGTAEIYAAIETLEELADTMVLSIEKENGTYWMPLFVQMTAGSRLNHVLKQKINQTLRQKYSPRHVPDEILEVPEIPYTISGKKMEMPIKKILMGVNPEKAISFDAMRNAKAADWFIEKSKEINT